MSGACSVERVSVGMLVSVSVRHAPAQPRGSWSQSQTDSTACLLRRDGETAT